MARSGAESGAFLVMSGAEWRGVARRSPVPPGEGGNEIHTYGSQTVLHSQIQRTLAWTVPVLSRRMAVLSQDQSECHVCQCTLYST